MEFFIIDISGKVVNYDIALCEALSKKHDVQLTFFSPLHKERPICNTVRLLNFVPQRFKTNNSLWKRLIKLCELVFNYLFIIIEVYRKKPGIIHFQWFPLLDFSSAEIPIVRLIRRLSCKSMIVLTIHNVFPHISNEDQRNKYKLRFLKMDALIDHYIVHTETTAKEVCQIYGLNDNRVSIVHHGIFKPNYQLKKTSVNRKDKKTIIFYGVNRKNKGGDILIDAVRQLPEEYRKSIKVVMAGKTPERYLMELQEKAIGVDIEFKPTFIPDHELYQMIDGADYIALPYREISQSGVLLLALYFRKPLLISDLPSFKETLKGFTSNMFFEAENSIAMRDLIVRMINGEIDTEKELQIIEKLNSDYSWENSASKTISVYKQLTY